MTPAPQPGNGPGEPAPFNHLIHEKSPYLLQHAQNPVNWYPWGEEAFSRAECEDKPVFLSVGYATCHWCHVMAHESFKNPGIAAALNRDFVCIKVDREERPDIDSLYMEACQLMTGSGGWPLSVFLTPDKKPFFAGTYFPPERRFGMIGFPELLAKITALWKDQRTTLMVSASEMLLALKSRQDMPHEGEPDPQLLHAGYDALAAAFDPARGGFGRAPKFPSPLLILFLLRYSQRTGNRHALHMAEQTILAMQCGGICDQVGGGFHRYSVDADWLVPHFEKMLYDQALLSRAYTKTAILTGNLSLRRTAEATLAYALRDLTTPEGAFISAEDADSPDGEGAFYLWTREGIEAVLGADDARLALNVFPLIIPKNPALHGAPSGTGILTRTRTPDMVGAGFLDPEPDFSRKAESIRSRLFAARMERKRPSRDTKVLADGNGLMISSFATAYRAFGDARYLEAAEKAMDFILTRMRMPDGGLFHRYRDGEVAIPGFADDYTFVIRALLDLYLSGFNPSRLGQAAELHRYFTSHFLDEKSGGFYSTADNAEHLLVRKKEIYDGVVPSSNSMALENLAILSLLTADPEYEKQASELSRAFAGTVQESPSAYTGFLSALDLLVNPSTVVAIAGSGPHGAPPSMIREVWDQYLPSVFLVWCRDEDPDAARIQEELMPFTRNLVAAGGTPTAYICKGHRCSLPVTGDLLRHLGEK
ncbi:MAG: thioredoxin domain-containing protein [Methanoregula sp.]